LNSPSIEAWGLCVILGTVSRAETKSLLSLADIWLFKLIVDTFSLKIEVGKVVESLREGTFLEESLLVVTFEVVNLLVLESEPIFFSLLSSKENKDKIEEAEILFKKYLVI